MGGREVHRVTPVGGREVHRVTPVGGREVARVTPVGGREVARVTPVGMKGVPWAIPVGMKGVSWAIPGVVRGTLGYTRGGERYPGVYARVGREGYLVYMPGWVWEEGDHPVHSTTYTPWVYHQPHGAPRSCVRYPVGPAGRSEQRSGLYSEINISHEAHRGPHSPKGVKGEGKPLRRVTPSLRMKEWMRSDSDRVTHGKSPIGRHLCAEWPHLPAIRSLLLLRGMMPSFCPVLQESVDPWAHSRGKPPMCTTLIFRHPSVPRA